MKRSSVAGLCNISLITNPVLDNLSASNFTIAKNEYRRDILFKRDVATNGSKVGGITADPRGDMRIPADARSTL